VGNSQEGYHFGSPVVPALPESILVGTNALHFVLRAFVSTRMCYACVTGGTRSLKYWYPTKLSLTNTGRLIR
jgi:hypothetical protein